ncbi:MAG: MotE family protein [Desulfonatronovibrio sp.]
MFLAVMKISFMLGMLGNVPEPGTDESSRPVLVKAGLALAQEEQEPDSEPADDEQEVNVGDELMRLREREEELDRRERNLSMLEEEIDEKLAELERLEASLDKMLEEADVLKDQKIKHLVDVYANMKPQQAAQVLETLDESIAVKILAGMRGRQAGDILTDVDSQKAARLSELLTEMQTPFID